MYVINLQLYWQSVANIIANFGELYTPACAQVHTLTAIYFINKKLLIVLAIVLNNVQHKGAKFQCNLPYIWLINKLLRGKFHADYPGRHIL